MWDMVTEHFRGYPARGRVARLLLEYGLGVRGGRAFCGEIELSDTALSKAADTDRRTVRATIETIETTERLSSVFSKLSPTCSFKSVAPLMNWGVLEIVPENVSGAGILADVTRIIAEAHISIRQVIADDPDITPDPRAFIVTERVIPGKLLPRIKAVRGVNAVVIY